MIRKAFVFTAVVLACGSMFAASARPVSAQEGQRPGSPILAPNPATGAASHRTNLTLTGCLYAESQVQGRTPGAGEGGTHGDFVLVNDARKEPASAAAKRAVGADAEIYKVGHLSDDRLKAFVGKHVEIAGRVVWGKTIAGERSPAGSAGSDGTLARIDARSIREVPGTCPATPAVPR